MRYFTRKTSDRLRYFTKKSLFRLRYFARNILLRLRYFTIECLSFAATWGGFVPFHSMGVSRFVGNLQTFATI